MLLIAAAAQELRRNFTGNPLVKDGHDDANPLREGCGDCSFDKDGTLPTELLNHDTIVSSDTAECCLHGQALGHLIALARKCRVQHYT